MPRLFSLVMLSATLCAGAGLADAQSIPDMKGSWTGTSKTIIYGLTAHHPAGTSIGPAADTG
jgi:hypothetical protein